MKLKDGIHAMGAGKSDSLPSVKSALRGGYDIKDIVVVSEIKNGSVSRKAVFVKIPGGATAIKPLDRHTREMADAARQFFIDRYEAGLRRR